MHLMVLRPMHRGFLFIDVPNMRNLLYARHLTTFHGILIPSTTFGSSSLVSSKDAFVAVINIWSITGRSFTKCGESSVRDLTTSFVPGRVQTVSGYIDSVQDRSHYIGVEMNSESGSSPEWILNGAGMELEWSQD